MQSHHYSCTSSRTSPFPSVSSIISVALQCIPRLRCDTTSRWSAGRARSAAADPSRKRAQAWTPPKSSS
jgi:hypothetical protein